MNTIKLIEMSLRSQGFDGLVECGICGCEIGELSPGDCLSSTCEAAYKHIHSERPNDWVMSINKEKMTDEEIESTMRECG